MPKRCSIAQTFDGSLNGRFRIKTDMSDRKLDDLAYALFCFHGIWVEFTSRDPLGYVGYTLAARVRTNVDYTGTSRSGIVETLLLRMVKRQSSAFAIFQVKSRL